MTFPHSLGDGGCKAQDPIRNSFVCRGYLGHPSLSHDRCPCLANRLWAAAGPCPPDKAALLMGDRANSPVQAAIAAALCPGLGAGTVLPALVGSICFGTMLGTSAAQPALPCSLPALPMPSVLSTRHCITQ